MRICMFDLLVFALLTMHVLSPARATQTQCGDDLERPVTLDQSGADKFPERKYQKKLRRAKKGVKEWLEAAEENVAASVEEEKKMQANAYPSCLHENGCPSSTTVAQYWQVPGKKCWNLEPVTWVTCETKAPDYGCRPSYDGGVEEAVGYSCRERYTNMIIWVYCSDRSGIQLMTIGVPTACIVTKNSCLSSLPV